MAMRFRKSIKLAPGVRLNVGKRGISTSLGARGASVNIGKNGVHSNIGIPGTGLSSRNKLSPGTVKKNIPMERKGNYGVIKSQITLEENGKLLEVLRLHSITSTSRLLTKY